MDMMYLSMVDIAYDLMTKKKKEVEFAKLFQEVSEIKGFTPEVAEEKMSTFYTDITLDGRFITLGENRWDLRERHAVEIVLDDEDEDVKCETSRWKDENGYHFSSELEGYNGFKQNYVGLIKKELM